MARRLFLKGLAVVGGGVLLSIYGPKACKKITEGGDLIGELFTGEVPSIEELMKQRPTPSVIKGGENGDQVLGYYAADFGDAPEDQMKDIDELKKKYRRAAQVLLASEDKEFFTRDKAYDTLESIGRMAIKGRGGSTIWVQIAKMILGRKGKLAEGKEGEQKGKEWNLANAIYKQRVGDKTGKEARNAKRKALLFYMNNVSYAHGTQGFKAAAQTYFNKPLDQLQEHELALLTCMLQANTRFDALRETPEEDWGEKSVEDIERRIIKERNAVLGALKEVVPGPFKGSLTQEESVAAQQQPLSTQYGKPKKTDVLAPHFKEGRLYKELGALLMRPEVQAELGITVAPKAGKTELSYDQVMNYIQILGLQIETTLDPEMQKKAEFGFKEGLATVKSKIPSLGNLQGCALGVHPTSGEVLFYVGGENYEKGSKFDWVEAQRQVGSMMKALVYATAMEHGIIRNITDNVYYKVGDPTPYPLLDLDGLAWYQGSPGNPAAGAPPSVVHNSNDGEKNAYLGQIRRCDAFHDSKNTAVWHLWNAGVGPLVAEKLKKFGLEYKHPDSPSELIGGGSNFTAEDVARIYLSFTNGGTAHDKLKMIRSIKTKDGKEIYDANRKDEQQVHYTPDVRNENTLNSTLKLLRYTLTTKSGTIRQEAQDTKKVVGAKTGTTNDGVDLGCSLISTTVNTVVRFGNNDYAATHKTAPEVARPVGLNIMKHIDTHEVASFWPDDLDNLGTPASDEQIVPQEGNEGFGDSTDIDIVKPPVSTPAPSVPKPKSSLPTGRTGF